MSISEARKSSFDNSLLTFDFDHPPYPPTLNLFLLEWKTGTMFACQIMDVMDDEKKTRGKLKRACVKTWNGVEW